MDVRELRIGNWIKSPIESGGTIARVIHINTDKDGYNHFLDHCTPIPLTEEWLLKFGFKKTKYEYKDECPDLNYFIKGDFKIFIMASNKDVMKDIFMPAYSMQVFDHLELTSIHQLQNLYFALTNKEL